MSALQQLHQRTPTLVKLLSPLLLIVFVVTLDGCQSLATSDATSQPASNTIASGWELVWSDEFDSPELSSDNWLAESGAGGWGNNELQFYTDRPENLRIEDGVLVIEAREEDYRGSRYTSARIKTQYRHTFQFGRIEARMKLPTGKGIWPAFWMLGEDMPTVGWPRAGEIDIMENIGDPHTIHGTVHGPGYSGGSGVGRAYTARDKALDQDFHTYAVEWAPGEIRWYLDDVLFNTITEADVPGAWVYDHPFFIILNLAVGGNWPGYPDTTT
ncbi:MAG: family 16 glycosylhydrolase, partial [Caldilinea sp.]